jgi:transposase-like protein
LLPAYARRTGALDDLVLSLTAKGLTSGEIVSHLAQTYGMTTTKETISTITDKALESMAEWRTRPLDPVYPVVFIDAVHVKIRDGHVANRPIYVAIAVTADGYREILSLWAGNGGEGAKYWQTVLTEIKNRGVRDVLMLVCDGLSALPDAVSTVWPQTVVQTCVVHLIRASLRYASRRDWAEVARDHKPVYTAVNEEEARQRLADFDATWGKRYPSIAGTWQRAPATVLSRALGKQRSTPLPPRWPAGWSASSSTWSTCPSPRADLSTREMPSPGLPGAASPWCPANREGSAASRRGDRRSAGCRGAARVGRERDCKRSRT